MQERIVEHLGRLIGFDTVSANPNLALVAHVQGVLAMVGVECRLVPDATGKKANLLATLGPKDRPGLVLSGHTDVVPVEGQAWTHDPFAMAERDGRLFGRGAADMKGYLAVVLALAEQLAKERLHRPVHLAFSYDEEVGCKGVPDLIEVLLAERPRPFGCVVGEPSMMRIIDGHKGKVGARITVIGREGHSALPHEGANAVMAAGEIIAFIARTGRDIEARGPFDEGFRPPHTTASVGRIEGGSQLNITPRCCSFELEFRCLPEERPEDYLDQIEAFARGEILERLQRTAPEAEVRVDVILSYPGFRADMADPFCRTCLELSHGDKPGKVAFGTEAGHFQRAGVPTVVCGPGDIAVAHKPDEWIARDQLSACYRYLETLVDRFCREA